MVALTPGRATALLALLAHLALAEPVVPQQYIANTPQGSAVATSAPPRAPPASSGISVDHDGFFDDHLDADVAEMMSEDMAWAYILDGGEMRRIKLSAVEEDKETWDCDVRSWVRAPDLAPGKSVPADVRLAMNGSACGDVQSWAVGAVMKERAVLKVL